MRLDPARVMFIYWGRRGSLAKFTLEVGLAAVSDPRVAATISVSRQSELFAEYSQLGDALFPVDTFERSSGAVLEAWRIPGLRRCLAERLRRDRIEVVIELMAHVWSPLVVPAIKRLGVRYVPVIHDAAPHPGDPTALVNGWLNRIIPEADLIFTLSSSVATRLADQGLAPAAKIFPLFHPDLDYGPGKLDTVPGVGRSIRLLFLGRILPYKGLGLFLESVELLRQDGIDAQVGVFGEGDLGEWRNKLDRLGAEVVNRWLSDDEISAALSSYHAVVLSHTSASQSGVAAAAFGAGRPVIATPVGGLLEQVQHGVTGLMAVRVDARALADEIKALVEEPGLYAMFRREIANRARDRSVLRFVEECVSQAVHIPL